MISHINKQRPLEVFNVGISIKEVRNHHIETKSCNFISKFPVDVKAIEVTFKKNVQWERKKTHIHPNKNQQDNNQLNSIQDTAPE